MDDLDAPQWADFIAPSPQLPLDDYFLKRHETHEYRLQQDFADSDSSNVSKKLNQSKQPLNDSSYGNVSVMQKTPKRSMCSKEPKISNVKKGQVKETTYEKVLSEAMMNLQLSFKSKGDKSVNKSCLMDSPAFKTPVKRVTRSMCAQAVNTPKQNLEKSMIVSPSHEKSVKFDDHVHDYCDEDKENVHSEEIESPVYDQTSQIHLEVTVSSSENEISQEKVEQQNKSAEVQEQEEILEDPKQDIDEQKEILEDPKQDIDEQKEVEQHVEEEVEQHIEEEVEMEEPSSSKQIPRSKVVSTFTSEASAAAPSSAGKKKIAALTGTAWHRHMKRRMSITNHRRLSIAAKVAVQQPSKFVSMAEAVNKFQRATPQRFHTAVKTTKTEQLRRQSFKLTRAYSPALMCKNRSRPVTALSREEQERLELEKIRQNTIKANPVRKDILLKPAPLKKVEKKTITNPEPFHLTQTKKGQIPALPQEAIKRPHRMPTKTVPTIVSTTDKGVFIKDEEVLHFGIPIEPAQSRKKNTKIIPFSFEARNRELQARKQEKMKALQEDEKHKVKPEFHARPVPAAVKTPINKAPLKDDSTKKPKITITRSLSFENRIKEVQKKKEEKMKQIMEEEKKARVFKAHKVPEFKPVLVRGRSRDNLLKKSMENLSIKPCINTSGCNKSMGESKKTASADLKKSHENLSTHSKNLIKPALSIPHVAPRKIVPPQKITENQENRNHGAVPKILEPKCKLSQKSVAVLTELNTDKRAKQRKEFDEQLKKKEMEEEERKKRDEEERLAREKAEKLELRKQAMPIKARPMPVYKPMNVVRSNKPLTEAQSPAWAKRKGSMQ